MDDLRCREADADRFVRPQRRFANIVIHFAGPSADPFGATAATTLTPSVEEVSSLLALR